MKLMMTLLEREMMYISGPLGTFVIKKQVKEMGYEMDTFPEEKMGELIDKVVASGVYDKTQHKKVAKELRRKILGS